MHIIYERAIIYIYKIFTLTCGGKNIHKFEYTYDIDTYIAIENTILFLGRELNTIL